MQPLHGCEDAFNHVFPLDAYAFINAALFLRPIGKGSGLIRHLKANAPNRFNILAIVHLAELAADIADVDVDGVIISQLGIVPYVLS